MQKTYLFLPLLLLTFLCTCVRAQTYDLTFNLATASQMNINEPVPGTYDITTTGNDAKISVNSFMPGPYDPGKVYVISFDYFAGPGLDDLEIFYGLPISATRKGSWEDLPATPNGARTFKAFMKYEVGNWVSPYQAFRFDISKRAGQSIRISNIQLREPTATEVIPITLDPNEINANATTVTDNGNGSFTIATSGADPYIGTLPFTNTYDPNRIYVLEYDYTGDELDDFRVFFGQPWDPARMALFGPLPAAATTTRFNGFMSLGDANWIDGPVSELRFDFGKNENATRQISVRNPVLRKPTAQEKIDELNSDKFLSQAINLQFNQYRTKAYADKVTSVKVDSTQVTISGTVTGAGPYYLAEVDPEDYGFNLDTYENLQPLAITDGSFTVQQPRYAPLADRNKDRLYARWTIVTDDGDGTYTRTSPMSWATDIVYAAENNLPEDKAATIKGLDGLTPGTLGNFSDLTDLDIKSMKINLVLNGVFALNPGPNTSTH